MGRVKKKKREGYSDWVVREGLFAKVTLKLQKEPALLTPGVRLF